MTAVLKHELANYFHSLTAYIFGAFLLVFVGIGAMLYNIQAAVSNFEYVLQFSEPWFCSDCTNLDDARHSGGESRRQTSFYIPSDYNFPGCCG